MNKEVWIIVTQVLGNIFVSLIVLSAIPTFWRIEKTQNVGKLNIYPFVVFCGSSMSWVAYGSLCNVVGVVPVNCLAMLFNLLYISIFLSASQDKLKNRKVTLSFFLYISFMVSFILILYWLVTPHYISQILGWFCSILTSIFIFSPIFFFYYMIKEKSVESLSVTMSAICLCSGTTYSIYGLLIKDYFVMVPNVIGVIFKFENPINDLDWVRGEAD
ncbi:hypothetical protein CYY_000660 [Polysphondylium violaceum]|uniref:Sugar transporter SWEET1 n=1 Tax=Polysphondylium violaceum TaxID=133409 RepID=A0A8J4Q3D8_9MYCE|nr:hypothetical protein CYY_000660 [Polysphondylium violaceum]